MQLEKIAGREAPLIRALDINYREGNPVALKLRLPQAMSKIRDTIVKPLVKSYLFYHVARIYRLFGETERAVTVCENTLANLPADSLGLLADLKRLRVALYLDELRFAEAQNLIGEIDGLELLLQGGVRHIEPAKEHEVETLILQTEIYFLTQQIDEAKKTLEKAANRLSKDDTEARRNSKLTFAQLRDQNQRVFDLGNELYFLEAVGRLLQSEDTAYAILQNLKGKLVEIKGALTKNFVHNANLLAKTEILLGEWEAGDDLPNGINQFEAHRWNRLAMMVGNDTGLLAAAAEHHAAAQEVGREIEGNGVFKSDAVALTNGTAFPESISPDVLTSLANSFSQLPGILSQLTDKLAQPPAAPAETVIEDLSGYSASDESMLFGGNFVRHGPIEKLSAPGFEDFTGYVECYWVAAMIEPAIRAHNLPAEARMGRGFLFVKHGRIIDATLGHYDVPPELSGDRSDALKAVTTITQIAYSVGIDTPRGYLKGYHSAAIMDRKPRLDLSVFSLMDIMTELEKKLGLGSGDGLNFDFDAGGDKF